MQTPKAPPRFFALISYVLYYDFRNRSGLRGHRHYSPNSMKDNSMQLRMLDVEGFILVGGESSRMGADKSRLVLRGKTTVQMVAQALESITTLVRTVGARATGDPQLANIPDDISQWGPLGGIHSALSSAGTEWCLIVACDLPFITAGLVGRLLTCIDGVDAVVPIQEDGRPQPLCALYRCRTCLVATKHSIAGGAHSPRALLDQISTRYVPFAEIADLENSEYFFFNVNTPADLEVAEKIAVRLS